MAEEEKKEPTAATEAAEDSQAQATPDEKAAAETPAPEAPAEKTEAPAADVVEEKAEVSKDKAEAPAADDAAEKSEAPAAEETKVKVMVRKRSENQSDTYLKSSSQKTPVTDDDQKEEIEKVVFINRCAKVVKGGRRFSFSALVVLGDGKGSVGIGFGKANEVAESIRKANEDARKNQEKVSLYRTTIPHQVLGEFGGSKVLMRPASIGTGLIAGGGVRAVVEAAGIQDLLAKSLGSSNPSNVVKATLEGLRQLRQKDQILKARGKLKAKVAS
jgi:small subunit ribosomal protein S5